MMYAYRFNPVGDYLGKQDRIHSAWLTDSPPDQRSKSRLSGVLGWADELGLTAATIHVRKFHSGYDDPQLELYDHPSYFEDGDFGLEDRRESTIRDWSESGAFVLHWCTTEYTLTREGERFQ